MPFILYIKFTWRCNNIFIFDLCYNIHIDIIADILLMLALNTNQSIHINKQYFISGIVQLVSYKLYQCFQQKMNVKYVVGNCRFKYDSSLTKKHLIIKKTLFLSSWKSILFTHFSMYLLSKRNTMFTYFYISYSSRKNILSMFLLSEEHIIIPSPTKLRRDIVTLSSVRPSITSFNGFWPNLVHT
jgi:hypothetical protein